MTDGSEQAVVTGWVSASHEQVTLGRSHSLSGPQFLHLPRGCKWYDPLRASMRIK